NKQIWTGIDKTKKLRAFNYSILYPLLRLLPLKKKTVVFDRYWSESFNCNTKAIYEYIDKNYPDYECVWFFKNPNIAINGKGKKVRRFSYKYWYYLARAKYFVENTNMPNQYAKRKNQIEVLTLH